ncbi:hypothetical protein [Uliginosibacterium sp. H1]|uniref:hypothetical protein n=1 Tax=Uliginosibacterium sp. H1 TaxID=3114757 RepID=UPI002E1703F5|nr:hypothetical protein [Uliginosibacterium sp. H1]
MKKPKSSVKIGALTLVTSLLLPAAVQAAPLYQYTYTSGAFTDPTMAEPQFVGQRFTIDIWSPTALGLGSLPTTGVTARGTAPGIQIDFPLPPPSTSCQPDPWFPDGGCTEQPDYPYATSALSLLVSGLDANGLPSGWELSLDSSWVTGWRFNETSYLTLNSFYYSETSFVDDIYGGTPPNLGLLARNVENNRGSWRVTVTEVPAPATLLLAGCAFAMLGLARRRVDAPVRLEGRSS